MIVSVNIMTVTAEIKEGCDVAPISHEYRRVRTYYERLTLKPFAAFNSSHVEYLILD